MANAEVRKEWNLSGTLERNASQGDAKLLQPMLESSHDNGMIQGTDGKALFERTREEAGDKLCT